MDDFKRETMEIVTAYDLLNCPVYYRPSERRKLLKMVRRRARRKRKQELNNHAMITGEDSRVVNL